MAAVPDYPFQGDDLADADKTRIAEAAWARSHGSIQAYEQLCREHANGELDLLAEPKPPEPGAGPAPQPSQGGGIAPNTSGLSADEIGLNVGGRTSAAPPQPQPIDQAAGPLSDAERQRLELLRQIGERTTDENDELDRLAARDHAGGGAAE